jgi:hypothetical protein
MSNQGIKMKIYVAWGCDIGSHTIIGVAKTQEKIDEITSKYKKDRIGFHPYVLIREFELEDN